MKGLGSWKMTLIETINIYQFLLGATLVILMELFFIVFCIQESWFRILELGKNRKTWQSALRLRIIANEHIRDKIDLSWQDLEKILNDKNYK